MVAFIQQGGGQMVGQVVDYLTKTCLLLSLSADKRSKLIGYLRELPPPWEWAKQHGELNERLQNLVIFITSLPEYQLN